MTPSAFHNRKPKAQDFGGLRLTAFEFGDVRRIDVDARAVLLCLSEKDSERLVQWVHRFDAWKREREAKRHAA